MSELDSNHLMFESGQYFDIWRLMSKPRGNNEALIRALCRSVYLGENTALCRVLGRYKMYVDTRDVSISSHLLLEGYWEMWVTEAMMRFVTPGMTVLDVGANLGYYTLLLADLVGPAGKVLAFEPNPEMASRARRSVGVNGFAPTTTVYEMALGDSDGEMLLNIVNEMPGGAYLLPGAVPAPATSVASAVEPVEEPLTNADAPLEPAARGEILPRPERLAVPTVVIVLPPPSPGTGFVDRLAARFGYARVADLTAARAALEASLADANAELINAAQTRIEAAIVEAVAAAESSAGARLAAAEAAAAARRAAAAAQAIEAHALAAITSTIQRVDEDAAAAAALGTMLRPVPVRRLDAIPGADDADFIKMDVEGAEHMVWSGMDGLLDRGRPLTIFMEFTIQRFGRPHDFLDEIERRGFSMAIIDYADGVVPISRDELFARSHAVDNMLVFSRGETSHGAA